MTAIAREEAQMLLEGGGVEVRTHEIGGDVTVSFIRAPGGGDLAPMLVGLPDDLCQCPRWGYVLSGRLKLATNNGDEIFEAGQAFYWSPGHAPMAVEDSEYVEFSPTMGSTSSSITSRRRGAELASVSSIRHRDVLRVRRLHGDQLSTG